MRWLYFRISVVAGSQWSKYWLTSGGILKRPLSGMWSLSQDFTWLRAGPVELYSLCTVTRTLSAVYFQAFGAELHKISQECLYFRKWSLEKTVTGKWLCLQQCIDKICLVTCELRSLITFLENPVFETIHYSHFSVVSVEFEWSVAYCIIMHQAVTPNSFPEPVLRKLNLSCGWKPFSGNCMKYL